MTDSGREIVVPGTFHWVDDRPLLMPWSLFTVVPRAMADAQAVIIFVFLAGGVIAVLRRTGAIGALIGSVLAHFRHRLGLLTFGAMALFAVLSASFGMAAEYIALVGVLLALYAALKLDALAAVGMMVVGYGIGYGCALFSTPSPS